MIVCVPAKTTVERAGIERARGVRPVVAVRMVPARVSVPDGLLITTSGRRRRSAMAAPVNVWRTGAIDQERARPAVERRGLADIAGARRGCRSRSSRRPGVSAPATVSVSPLVMVWTVVLLTTTSARVWLPLIVWVPAKTTVEVPGVERARGVRPGVGRPDRAGQGERARGLVDDDAPAGRPRRSSRRRSTSGRRRR